jgi:hypothetical protein
VESFFVIHLFDELAETLAGLGDVLVLAQMDLLILQGLDEALDLGRGFPGFELADHLPCELTGKATSFESQGDCLLSILKEA